jgi:hypothetical protein
VKFVSGFWLPRLLAACSLVIVMPPNATSESIVTITLIFSNCMPRSVAVEELDPVYGVRLVMPTNPDASLRGDSKINDKLPDLQRGLMIGELTGLLNFTSGSRLVFRTKRRPLVMPLREPAILAFQDPPPPPSSL